MAESWTVLKVLKWTTNHLGERGIANPRLDAEWLLADLLDLNRVGLYLQFDRPLQESELGGYRERVRRRAAREPLAYILGSTEFWSLTLRVNPAVLIPRPETELLIEEALDRLPSGAEHLLDVGTGSGCIALAMAKEREQLTVTGLDLSPAALAIATDNAKINDLLGRTQWVAGDLHKLPGNDWPMILSNPPYVRSGDIEGLMPEVRLFEPRMALDGLTDGLMAYRSLAKQTEVLAPGGWLLVEVGFDQASEVAQLFAEADLENIFIRNDYADIPRVVGGQRLSG